MHDKSPDQHSTDLNCSLQLIESAITHLLNYQQHVDECANKAKQEVRSGVNGILDSIRQREVQLLRQIEITHSHYKDTLHTQNAKLHQILGIIKHAMSSENYSNSVLPLEDIEYAEEVLRQKLLPDSINFTGNVEDTCSLVQQFGTLTNTPGFIGWHSSEETVSKCLPSRLEEYEDAEHHLLYKTLEELYLERKSKVSTSFSFEEWLRPTSKTTSMCENKISPPEFLVMRDVSFWLKENFMEETSHFLTDDKCSFEVVEHFSDDESIELIPHSFLVEKHFPNIVTYPSNSSCKDRLCCGSVSTLDIENLGESLCGSAGSSCKEYICKWLKEVNPANLNTLLEYPLNMEDVCVANKCCSSFSECLCKEKCVSKAFEIIDSKMSEMQLSESDWLKSPYVQFEKWLKMTRSTSEEKMDISEKQASEKIEKINNNCQWFKSQVVSSNSEFFNDEKDWLTSSINTQLNDSDIRSDFEIYFKNNDTVFWLP